MRTAIFIAGALLTIGCTVSRWETRTFEGGAYKFKPGRVDIAQLQSTTLATAGAEATYLKDRVQIVVPDKERVFLFTLEAHPAHPAVIIVDLVPSQTPFEAYSQGDLTKFDAWLLAISKERDNIVATYTDKQ